MGFFDGCPGSKRIKEPFPETVRCRCGKDIEIWSDEVETVCLHCKRKVSRNMPQSCLDWCSMARECVGEKKYKRYLEQRPLGS